jgi:hypothetical protein
MEGASKQAEGERGSFTKRGLSLPGNDNVKDAAVWALAATPTKRVPKHSRRQKLKDMPMGISPAIRGPMQVPAFSNT